MTYFAHMLILSLLYFYPHKSLCHEISPSSYTIIQDEATRPILTPSFAKRKILKLKLSNELQGYLISDPEAEASAAALQVNVGSWQDPKEYPGLAHFLEHMLFLGTRKYPKESEFDRYIKENGGISNAFTENLYTTFFFQVNHQAFEEALDRFADFFKEPLFNPSGVDRELQAIDQEFNNHSNNDEIRQLFVEKEIGNPNHPQYRFNIGNTKTLSGVSQTTLKKWYEEHYSANLMTVVVYSSLPLETIKEWVVHYFNPISNNDKKPFMSPTKTSSPEKERRISYVGSIRDIPTVTFSWELPENLTMLLETKPDQLICSVLGHEGDKSLLAQLKKEGLANALLCGKRSSGPHHATLLLQIELTETGLKEVHRVVERTFQAIQNVKNKGVPRYLFDNLHQLETISYQYPSRKEAFQTVLTHTRGLREENLHTYPEKSLIIQHFDPTIVQTMLTTLSPQNCEITVMAKADKLPFTLDHQERWMQVPYTLKSVPKETMKTWQTAQPSPNIDLPSPNLFIPQSLALASLSTNTPPTISPSSIPFPHPKLLINEEKGAVYFAADDRYFTPKISWHFEIKTPSVNAGNPRKIVLADLYLQSISDTLNQFTYDAKVAGLEYELKQEKYGISLKIEGYSEKAPLFLEKIVEKLTAIPSQEFFEVYKQKLLWQYGNFSKEIALKRASELLKSVLYQDFVTEQAKKRALEKIRHEDLLHYLSTLYQQNYTQALFYGNMTEQQALDIWHTWQTALGGDPYPLKEHKQPQIAILPQKKGPYSIERKLKTQGNAAILAIENEPYSFQQHAAQQILSQALNQAFFATLRTKQQTGYTVFHYSDELEKHLFNFFAVQSNTHDGRDLLARFELFLESYLQEIEAIEIPEERFNLIRHTLISQLEQSPKNLEEMGQKLTELAFRYQGEFDWMAKRIQGLKELSYRDFIDFSHRFLSRQNKRRLAILIEGMIPKENQFMYTRVKSIKELKQQNRYLPTEKNSIAEAEKRAISEEYP